MIFMKNSPKHVNKLTHNTLSESRESQNFSNHGSNFNAIPTSYKSSEVTDSFTTESVKVS